MSEKFDNYSLFQGFSLKRRSVSASLNWNSSSSITSFSNSNFFCIIWLAEEAEVPLPFDSSFLTYYILYNYKSFILNSCI
jgi:hypothetical protein